ncbi:MAG: hypothetical protein B7Z55_12545 [Planctomycetales bacterium 12-60-4]|nr:MAG: hypothetical protein B7Z55_12545 [Planctomycetales bacterium 12-60-4]
MTKSVLSVGQCVPDEAAIERYLQANFDVTVSEAATGPEALDLLRKSSFDLVLVNRKLDIDYSDGSDIIRAMQADPDLAKIPIMLVSNYPEYQDNAVQLGAQRGFGKNDLGRSDTTTLLQPFLS